MTIDDSEWYLENVIVPGDDPWTRLSPAQRRQSEWTAAADEAREREPSTHAAVDLSVKQGFVLTHEQARASGLSDADIRRLLRRGTWTAPRRNVLCVLPEPSAESVTPNGLRTESVTPNGLRTEIQATAAALVRPGSTISQESAAAIHGLALLADPHRPQLTMGQGNGEGRPNINVHAAALDEAEIEHWFGAGVTSVARTVVDVARNAGAGPGLVAADAALRDASVSRAELALAVSRAGHWPGVTVARRIVDLASPLAESPLESLSRLLIDDGGLPIPELQVWVRTARRSYRVDGLWRERRVVLEADGMGKYRAGADLLAEKLRQEALERAGYRVVRVLWEDIMHARAETLARIAEALRLGGRFFGVG